MHLGLFAEADLALQTSKRHLSPRSSEFSGGQLQGAPVKDARQREWEFVDGRRRRRHHLYWLSQEEIAQE